MEDVKIKLSALWAALMLTYLLGDVLRIFSGDFTARELGGLQISQELVLGMAALLVIPRARLKSNLFSLYLCICIRRVCGTKILI
jgi:hypothetical protein